MKRPLIAVVSGYVIGLLLAEIVHLPLGALFAVSFFVLVLVFVLKKLRPWLIWPLVVLVGWTNLAIRTAVISPDDLRTALGNDTAIVAVRGCLPETPRVKIVEREDQQTENTLDGHRSTFFNGTKPSAC